jgi:hypothetical protein
MVSESSHAYICMSVLMVVKVKERRMHSSS